MKEKQKQKLCVCKRACLCLFVRQTVTKHDFHIMILHREAWIQMGLENVHLAEYDFYLSWPNQTNPNKIYLLDEADQVATFNN